MNDKPLPREKEKKALIKQKEKPNFICEYLLAPKSGKMETRGNLWKAVMAPLLYLAIKPMFLKRYRNLSFSKNKRFSEYTSCR
jgi:hypothetical protein